MYRLIAALALLALLASGCSMTPSVATSPPAPLIPANLVRIPPPLSPLPDGSFPAVAGKLVDTSGRYYELREQLIALVGVLIKRGLVAPATAAPDGLGADSERGPVK